MALSASVFAASNKAIARSFSAVALSASRPAWRAVACREHACKMHSYSCQFEAHCKLVMCAVQNTSLRHGSSILASFHVGGETSDFH
jgi:hypothetical protein